MTRAEARTLLQSYLAMAAGDTRWPTADQNLYLQQANREVWYTACDLAWDRFLSSVQFTWVAGTLSYDLTSAAIINADYYRLRSVLRMQTSGAPSSSNRVLEALDYIPFSRLATAYAGGAQGRDGRIFYALQGDRMYLAPVPTAGIFLNVDYFPLAPNLSSGGAPDNNQLLSHPATMTAGRLDRHHEYVVVLAALRALARVRETSDHLSQVAARLAKAFITDLSGSARQVAQPVTSYSTHAAGQAE